MSQWKSPRARNNKSALELLGIKNKPVKDVPLKANPENESSGKAGRPKNEKEQSQKDPITNSTSKIAIKNSGQSNATPGRGRRRKLLSIKAPVEQEQPKINVTQQEKESTTAVTQQHTPKPGRGRSRKVSQERVIEHNVDELKEAEEILDTDKKRPRRNSLRSGKSNKNAEETEGMESTASINNQKAMPQGRGQPRIVSLKRDATQSVSSSNKGEYHTKDNEYLQTVIDNEYLQTVDPIGMDRTTKPSQEKQPETDTEKYIVDFTTDSNEACSLSQIPIPRGRGRPKKLPIEILPHADESITEETKCLNDDDGDVITDRARRRGGRGRPRKPVNYSFVKKDKSTTEASNIAQDDDVEENADSQGNTVLTLGGKMNEKSKIHGQKRKAECMTKNITSKAQIIELSGDWNSEQSTKVIHITPRRDPSDIIITSSISPRRRKTPHKYREEFDLMDTCMNSEKGNTKGTVEPTKVFSINPWQIMKLKSKKGNVTEHDMLELLTKGDDMEDANNQASADAPENDGEVTVVHNKDEQSKMSQEDAVNLLMGVAGTSRQSRLINCRKDLEGVTILLQEVEEGEIQIEDGEMQLEDGEMQVEQREVVVPSEETQDTAELEDNTVIACDVLSRVAEDVISATGSCDPAGKMIIVEDVEEKKGLSKREGTLLTWRVQDLDESQTNLSLDELQDSIQYDDSVDKYMVQVVSPVNFTSTARSKPNPHLILSSRLASLMESLKPDDDMTNHTEPVAGGRTEKCGYCEVIILNRHHFRQHIRTHKDVTFKPWKCPLCDYRADIKAQVARHINIHGMMSPFICQECGRGFNFKQKLLQHMRYHLDLRDRSCPVCGLAFHEFKTLRNHMRAIHKIMGNLDSLKKKNIRSSSAAGKPSLQVVVETSTEEGQVKTALAKILPTKITEHADAVKDANVVKTEDKELKDATEANKDTNVEKLEDKEVKLSPENELIENDNEDTGSKHEITKKSDHDEGTKSEQQSAKASSNEKLENESDKMQDGGKSTKEISGRIGESVLDLEIEDSAEGKIIYLKTSDKKKIPLTFEEGRMVLKENPLRKPRKLQNRKTQIMTSNFKSGIRMYTDSVKKAKKVVKRKVNKVRCQDQLEENLQSYCEVIEKIAESGTYAQFRCNLCREVFRHKTSYIQHLEKEHTNIKAWKCKTCEYTSRTRCSMITHEKIHQGAERNHECEQCGKKYYSHYKLRKHMATHMNLRPYACEQCERRFNENYDLKRHILRIHPKEFPFQCEVCKRRFTEKITLTRHMDLHNESKFRCSVCKKLYRTQGSLQQHMKGHSCMFHCEICDKSFSSYSGFMAHKVMHDESYGGFKCPHCDSVLLTKGSLKRHLKVVHSSARQFVCDKDGCTKAYKAKKDLKAHMASHNREDGVFNCLEPDCDFKSGRADSLKVHMLVHSDKKPFVCQYCDKQYTQKHALEIHLKHHTGEIDSRCELCGREFMTKYALMLHMKRRHVTNKSGNKFPKMIRKPHTMFLCEECNMYYPTQDKLAIHILAEHMKQSWNKEGGTDTVNVAAEVEVDTDSIVEGIAAVEEMSSDGTSPRPLAAAVNLVHAGMKTQTLNKKYVSLLNKPVRKLEAAMPVGNVAVQHVMFDLPQGQKNIATLINPDTNEETMVTISDPQLSQELFVSMPTTNFENLLSATSISESQDFAPYQTFITINKDGEVISTEQLTEENVSNVLNLGTEIVTEESEEQFVTEIVEVPMPIEEGDIIMNEVTLEEEIEPSPTYISLENVQENTVIETQINPEEITE